MGMFDYINFEMNCPKCGELITGFQSKDAHCILATLEVNVVDNFYSSCDNCGCWVEFNKKKKIIDLSKEVIQDYVERNFDVSVETRKV